MRRRRRAATSGRVGSGPISEGDYGRVAGPQVREAAMPEDPAQQPNPSDSPDCEGVLSTDELEEVLLQAAALAADLHSQVGADDITPPSFVNLHERLPQEPGGLDAALSELESLVEETSEQVDDQAPATPAEESGEDTPDFMADLMAKPDEAAAKQDAPAKDAPTPGPVAPKPDVARTTPAGAEPSAATDEAASVVEQKQTALLKVRSLAGALSRMMIRIVEPHLLSGTEYVVQGLEAADRPLSILGDRGRRVLGWVAIATFGTSLMIFVYTCF